MTGREVMPVGTVLDGGYRIDQVLGAGGFAITYEAEDVRLARRVAIKEFFPDEFAVREGGTTVRARSSGADDFTALKQRFLSEARTLARFRHQSVVHVTRVFEDNGTAYMVLDFEAGPTFGRWLEELGRPPEQAELDDIADHLLGALDYVHAAGVLHRDIAPDNIIMRDGKTPVLIDFGAARNDAGARSRTLAIVKRGFSPLEQYQGRSDTQGPWTDIYALAATFWRALKATDPPEATGRFPTDTMQPAMSLAPSGRYRLGFLDAIDKGLALDHRERPRTVEDWREMLLGPPPAPGYAPSPDPTPGPWGPSSGPALQPPVHEHVYATSPPPGQPPISDPFATGHAFPPPHAAQPPARRGGAGKWIFITLAALLLMGGGGGLMIKLARDAEIAQQRQRQAEDRAREAERAATEARKAAEAKAKPQQQQPQIVDVGRQAPGGETCSLPSTPIQVGSGTRCLQPGRGEAFRDCDACPEMVVIPTGTFQMGTPESEGRSSEERPVHVVTISRIFAVGKFEITFAEWQACVSGGGCRGNPNPEDAGFGRGRRPAINISFNDAKQYVSWISSRTGKTYRLLSEAEWEYVARAGGRAVAPQRGQAQFSAKQTAPVGSFAANPWGVHDIVGNVWEWVEDCWNASYNGAPRDGSSWLSGDCNSRVLRGPGWSDDPPRVHPSERGINNPDGRFNFNGFRIARTL